MQKLSPLVGALIMLFTTTAHAYIGPGASAGTIAVVLGIIASIFLAIVAIVWYPLKRLIKRCKSAKQAEKSEIDVE
ncbi:MAG: preprotein translocase subunit SecF [Gammaproteobacteria bacterium]|jgi:hypothetical protein